MSHSATVASAKPRSETYPLRMERQPDQDEIAEGLRLQFDCLGYIILRQVLQPSEVDDMKCALAQLEQQTYDDSAWMDALSMPTKSEFAQAVRLSGIVRLSPAFDRVIGHPKVWPFLQAFVNNPMLVNTWAINKHQGKGHVGWHSGVDAFQHFNYNNKTFTSMLNMIWALDDNNTETGCPIVLPGSHKRVFNPQEHYELLDLPGSVPVILEPGDVLIFSEATLHGGLPRKIPGSRRNLYINYIDGRRGVTNRDGNLHHYWLPPEVRARFPQEKQSLFEWMKYCQVP